MYAHYAYKHTFNNKRLNIATRGLEKVYVSILVFTTMFLVQSGSITRKIESIESV